MSCPGRQSNYSLGTAKPMFFVDMGMRRTFLTKEQYLKLIAHCKQLSFDPYMSKVEFEDGSGFVYLTNLLVKKGNSGDAKIIKRILKVVNKS